MKRLVLQAPSRITISKDGITATTQPGAPPPARAQASISADESLVVICPALPLPRAGAGVLQVAHPKPLQVNNPRGDSALDYGKWDRLVEMEEGDEDEEAEWDDEPLNASLQAWWQFCFSP